MNTTREATHGAEAPASEPQSIPLLQYRERLLNLAQSPDPCPFISMVDAYLAAVPNDEQIRALAAGALLRKGLNSVAVEIVSAGTEHSASLAEVAAQLQRLPSTCVEWATTEQRFEDNLRAIRQRGWDALAAGIEQGWAETAPRLQLHQANDGNSLIRATTLNGQKMWIPAAVDFAGTSERIPDAEVASWKGSLPPPFLLDSVGMGWFAMRLHEATQRTYLTYSPAIFIVERNLPAIASVLRIHDWTPLLSDPRVYLFGGAEAWEEWRALMSNDSGLNLPRLVQGLMRWDAGVPSPAAQVLDQVTREREELQERERARAEALYTGRDACYWAERFRTASPANPLRVLGLTSRYTTYLQHSTRDALAAFERAGAVTKVLIEDRDHATIPPHAYMQTFSTFEPDLVLVLDHHRYEYASRFIQNVPYVCWIQDELVDLFAPGVGAHLGPLDFTMGFGLAQCVLKAGYPRERFMPCRITVNIGKLAGAGSPDSSCACDVAYVSHASETPAALHQRIRQQAGDANVCRLIDAFYEETRDLFASERFNGAYDLENLVAQVAARIGLQYQDRVTYDRLMSLFVRPLADRTLRHTTLEWAAQWADATGRRLHIYGNGWDRHPRFGKYAQGPAQHGEHLGRIARESAINLHTGLNPALHQRVFETLGAGGFLMVRHHLFDFLPRVSRLLQDYIERNGIRRPTRIPISALPAEYLEGVRERAALRGAPVPDTVQISDEWLLEQSVRRFWGDAHTYADQAFPRFAEITFCSSDEFIRRAEQFLANAEERRAIAGAMRASVERLFTYDALIPRLTQFVAGSLAAQAEATAAPVLDVSGLRAG